mgnify:CR=1 FL=1
MQNVSIGGSCYFVTLIDDYTWHTWVCLIEKKSEVFSCFLKVKSFVKWETSRKIKCLRTDGRKEYFSDQFSSYLQKEGIREEFSGPMAENSTFRMIEEVAREMLEEKHMPKFYWAEVVRMVVYLQNQTSANGGVSPHELYFWKKPKLAHLRVPKEKRRKLDAKAEKCILVGYSNEQVRVSRDVVFDEGEAEEVRCQSREVYLGRLLG